MTEIHEPKWAKKEKKEKKSKNKHKITVEAIKIVILLTIILAIINTLTIRRVTNTQQTHNRLFDSFQGLQQQMLKELRMLQIKSYKERNNHVRDAIIKYISNDANNERAKRTAKSRNIANKVKKYS